MDNSLFDAEDDDKENVRSGGHVTNASDVARSPLKPTAVHQTQNLSSENVLDFSDIPEDRQDKYKRYLEKSKALTNDGHIREAMGALEKAYKIFKSDKIQRRIAKFQEYLRNKGSSSEEEEEEKEEDDDNDLVPMGKGFMLYKGLYGKLYDHQKLGILFLWKLHRSKSGGILADDMGLGKTIQIIGFLAGLYDMEKIKSVLLVMPLSLIANWQREFENWAPGLNVYTYHGSSKRDKLNALRRVQKRSGILITTYGTIQTSWEELGADGANRQFTWDYIILDEGHKIKNHTNKTSKGIRTIPSRHRVIMTGTPVQNNIKEMWALFDFTHQGTLLGTQKTFKMEYENPICRAREKDASVGEKRLGEEMATSLRNLILPSLLRRTKGEIKDQKMQKSKEANHELNTSPQMPDLTRKNEFIVWCFLSQEQIKIYDDFLHQDEVKELLTSKRSPLVALTFLKKICDHPRLLPVRACRKLGLDNSTCSDQNTSTEDMQLQGMGPDISNVSDLKLQSESGKMGFLMRLIDQLIRDGSRVLVFSQSRKILDIVQRLLTNKNKKCVRLDGTISQIEDRERIIKKFQSDGSIPVFLLTTQVGGVGLTLTAADRVVIYDPAWNPATDAQAVDRAFRIGQKKNVVIYRLITCGTVEEKIYRRQVFKSSLTRQTVEEEKNPIRYFTKTDMKELFNLDDPKQSTTQIQLERMHSKDRKTDTHLDAHIAFLLSLNIFGLSDHDLMFDEKGRQDNDDEDDDPGGTYPEAGGVMHPSGANGEQDYIRQRVQRAQDAIQLESNLHGEKGVDAISAEAAADLKNKDLWGTQAPPTQTEEWLTQPVVGGDISFIDVDEDAKKRARSGSSFETEGDSVIELDSVDRPAPDSPPTQALSNQFRPPASTPMHNSTMMPGAAAVAAALEQDGDDAMVLDFSQIEAIEEDEVLQRTLEVSLNMSKREEREEEEEDNELKKAIEASLRETSIQNAFKVPSKPPNRLPSIDSPSTSAKFLQSSTSSSSSTKIDKRQTLFGGKPSLTADDDEDDDDDDSVVMTGTEHNSASGGSSGEVIVNDSMDDGNVEGGRPTSRVSDIVADSFVEDNQDTSSSTNKRQASLTTSMNSPKRKSPRTDDENKSMNNGVDREDEDDDDDLSHGRLVINESHDGSMMNLDKSEGLLPVKRKGGRARIVSEAEDNENDNDDDDDEIHDRDKSVNSSILNDASARSFDVRNGENEEANYLNHSKRSQDDKAAGSRQGGGGDDARSASVTSAGSSLGGTNQRRRSWMPKITNAVADDDEDDDEEIAREVASVVEEEDENEGSDQERDDLDADENSSHEKESEGESLQKSHNISPEASGDEDAEDDDEEEDDEEEDDEEEGDDERYGRLCEAAKAFYKAKNYASALQNATEALEIFDDQGLTKFIQKIKGKLN